MPTTLAIDDSIAYSSKARGSAAPSCESGERRVDQAGRAVHQALHGVGPGGHLAELVLDGAEGGDRLAELPALRRVLGRVADRRGSRRCTSRPG